MFLIAVLSIAKTFSETPPDLVHPSEILRNATTSENTFQSFNIEFIFSFSCAQAKVLILQNMSRLSLWSLHSDE